MSSVRQESVADTPVQGPAAELVRCLDAYKAHAHTGHHAGLRDEPRHRVVVGVDDTADSYIAVAHAAIAADRRGWPLEILHVNEPLLGYHRHGATGMRGSEVLRDAADHVAAALDIPVNTQLLHGSVAEALVAASRDAGLLTVGARKHGGVAEMWAGSLSSYVADYAHSPVMIVRRGAEKVSEARRHGVLTGIDGSAASYRAFEFALGEAWLREEPVIAVHATDAWTEGDPDPLQGGTMAGVRQDCMGIPVLRRRVIGDPCKQLLAMTPRVRAVVIGSRRIGDFRAPREESVAQALVRRSSAPLIVVHEPG